MKIRRASIIIFYTPEKKILLQHRISTSKWGEEWSYFGGGIEEGETPEEALVREVQEELSYTLTEYEKIGEVNQYVEQFDITGHAFIFVAPLPNTTFNQKEGDGMELFTIEEAKSLKLTPVIDYTILRCVEEFLSKK